MYQAEAVLSAIPRREFKEFQTISSKMKVAVLVRGLPGRCQSVLLTLEMGAASTTLQECSQLSTLRVGVACSDSIPKALHTDQRKERIRKPLETGK